MIEELALMADRLLKKMTPLERVALFLFGVSFLLSTIVDMIEFFEKND